MTKLKVTKSWKSDPTPFSTEDNGDTASSKSNVKRELVITLIWSIEYFRLLKLRHCFEKVKCLVKTPAAIPFSSKFIIVMLQMKFFVPFEDKISCVNCSFVLKHPLSQTTVRIP